MDAEDVRIERVRVRRGSPTLGYVDIRLPYVHLTGLRIAVQPDGSLSFKPQARQAADGKMWPCWALRPGAREIIGAVVAEAWNVSGCATR